MGEFFDKLQAAKDEFNVFDIVTVNAMMEHLFLPAADTQAVRELWPEAEPMLEGATLGLLLDLSFDRENAAKGRRAHQAFAFFEFATEAFLQMIEAAKAEQDQADP